MTTASATHERDVEAVRAVRRHHEELQAALAALVAQAYAAAPAGTSVQARDAVVAFCTDDLLPHAAAEERTMYAAAAALPQAGLLIASMTAEHGAIKALVDELAVSDSGIAVAAGAQALLVLFRVHLAKENDLVLPLLLDQPDVSVASLLAGMHELLGEQADT